MNCCVCQKPLHRGKKYCSATCQWKDKWIQRKNEIINTGIFPDLESSRIARRYLLEVYGNICQICKHRMWEGQPIPLVLDHIDGNSDNWEVNNCLLICPNCDTFTPFYKAKNKGNGRFKRRQRFLAGKSF